MHQVYGSKQFKAKPVILPASLFIINNLCELYRCYGRSWTPTRAYKHRKQTSTSQLLTPHCTSHCTPLSSVNFFGNNTHPRHRRHFTEPLALWKTFHFRAVTFPTRIRQIFRICLEDFCTCSWIGCGVPWEGTTDQSSRKRRVLMNAGGWKNAQQEDYWPFPVQGFRAFPDVKY